MDKKQNIYFSHRTVDAAIAVLSLLLLAYSGYRAAILSFTIDESQSFNDYVPMKFMDIVSYKHSSANNHILNTLWMKFISYSFVTSEFLLRLHSVFSHLIYIVFSYLIIKKISAPLLVFSGFLLLN